jgi:hypothetical protein
VIAKPVAGSYTVRAVQVAWLMPVCSVAGCREGRCENLVHVDETRLIEGQSVNLYFHQLVVGMCAYNLSSFFALHIRLRCFDSVWWVTKVRRSVIVERQKTWSVSMYWCGNACRTIENPKRLQVLEGKCDRRQLNVSVNHISTVQWGIRLVRVIMCLPWLLQNSDKW